MLVKHKVANNTHQLVSLVFEWKKWGLEDPSDVVVGGVGLEVSGCELGKLILRDILVILGQGRRLQVPDVILVHGPAPGLLQILERGMVLSFIIQTFN